MTPDQTRCVMTQIVMPMHTNGVAGVMFGGIMMQWIDVCAGVAAMRHAGTRVVTASIDRLDFLSPVLVGVPNVVGMSWADAQRTASARGVQLKPAVAAFTSVPMFVGAQDPAAPALVAQGSAVPVTLAAAKGAPLAVRVRPGQVSCKRANCIVRLRVELSIPEPVKCEQRRREGRDHKQQVGCTGGKARNGHVR